MNQAAQSSKPLSPHSYVPRTIPQEAGNDMGKVTEKALDGAIEEKFKTSHPFVTWFLGKTKFSDTHATYHWSRSNNPWGRVAVTIQDPKTGLKKKIVRDSETDILVVFESKDKERFALHIENKLANGSFTEYQPELYSQRARTWLRNEKYCSYTDYETILIAPQKFRDRWTKESQLFDQFISHEDISKYIPMFHQ